MMPNISRRDFLHRLTLGTAALSTGIRLFNPANAFGANQTRRLGVALLGLGRYSTNQLGPALRQTKLCTLAGVVTGHPGMMRLARERDFGPFMKMRGDRGFVFGQRAWRVDKKLGGGGPMMDLGIYIVHGACMAANGVAPVAVTAHEEPKTRPELFNEVEETIHWTMDFPNGARCGAVTSFNHAADKFRIENREPTGLTRFAR